MQSEITRAPRWQRDPDYPQGRIGEPEHKILCAIARFGYLSAEQLNTLLYSPGSIQGTRKRLQNLYQWGYLKRRPLAKPLGKGAALALYRLDHLGYSYLKKMGLEPQGRFRPDEEPEDFFLRHSWAANELLVLTHELLRETTAIEIVRFETERELKLHPVYIQLGAERVGVVPDGWAHLRVDLEQDIYELPICWELDRGTRDRSSFQRTIAARLAYIQDPYQAEFGTNSVTLAYAIAAGGQRRVEEVVSWTERVLAQLGARQFAPWFLFSEFDPEQTEALELFSAETWFSPFSAQPQSLLPLREMGS
jgi:hypothetical protein